MILRLKKLLLSNYQVVATKLRLNQLRKEEAPKAEEPKQPVDRPQTVQPAAEKQEPEQPKQTMVDQPVFGD